jgi:hypothetical protein
LSSGLVIKTIISVDRDIDNIRLPAPNSPGYRLRNTTKRKKPRIFAIMTKPTAKDRAEFRQYLRQCTDRQVQDKEYDAGRTVYAELAQAEAKRRGISITTRRERSYNQMWAR